MSRGARAAYRPRRPAPRPEPEGRPAGRPFDPADLVAAAQAAHPDDPALHAALGRCTEYWEESRAYWHFVPPHSLFPARGVLMLVPRMGEVLLDIHEGGTIIGIEFLNRLR
jgi:hypothetical protein